MTRRRPNASIAVVRIEQATHFLLINAEPLGQLHLRDPREPVAAEGDALLLSTDGDAPTLVQLELPLIAHRHPLIFAPMGPI
jgi:hypothetical protein